MVTKKDSNINPTFSFDFLSVKQRKLRKHISNLLLSSRNTIYNPSKAIEELVEEPVQENNEASKLAFETSHTKAPVGFWDEHIALDETKTPNLACLFGKKTSAPNHLLTAL